MNVFKNMFDVGFPVKSWIDPQSEILEKVHILKRIDIHLDR